VKQPTRGFPRYAVQIDARVILGSDELSARTRNLSRGGLCLNVARPVSIGTDCTVGLSLVFSESKRSEEISLSATVVWCTKVPGSHQLGLKFSQLSEQDQRQVNLFIQFLGSVEEEEAK
jgi:c-di-GMP-binding flagellar brake protein YcgR